MLQYRNNLKIHVATLFLGGAISAFDAAAADDEIKQKLNFAGTFISSSAAAKRIAASNNDEARAKYQAAQERLREAQSAFAAGSLEEARAKSDEAMNLMTRAAQLVPPASAQRMARIRNEELMQGIETLEASYKAALSEPGAQSPPGLNSIQIRKAVDTAKGLADEGKYEEANKILSAAMNELSDALNKLLASKTISYEMKFSSPAEEYTYELERYLSLENAIPLAIEQNKPSQNDLDMVEAHINKARGTRQQADADAKQEKYEAALEKIRDGTQQLETVLRLLGVTY
jgi:hypothetical protein